MTSDPADSPKRRQLLEAAARLFRASGFRAVTMEAIAAEAGAAKATLYANFPDKRAVFAAVVDHVARQIADALHAELARSGNVDERLARALIARHTLVFELVDGSPHARELMNARDDFARAPAIKIDIEMLAGLAAVLREDLVFAKNAEAMAKTLFKACIGVSASARSAGDIERDIGHLVRSYLAGVRALAEMQTRHERRVAGSGRR